MPLMTNPLNPRRDFRTPWTVRVRLDPTQNQRTLLDRLSRGARMSKSKPIGWITALTLLAAAGIALACRLKDGAGQPVQGSDVAWNGADKTPAPPDPAPVPTPLAESVPPPVPEKQPDSDPPATSLGYAPPKTPPTPAVESIPAPPPVAAVPVGPATEEKTGPPPTPPSETAVPPPPPLNAKLDNEPKKDAPPLVPALPIAEKKETAVAPPAVLEQQPGVGTVILGPAPLNAVRQPEAASPAPAPAAAPVENKTYWASQGETLRDVARKTLGQEDRWLEIEKLNPELRARTLIPAGTMVRLPAGAQNTGIKQVSGQSEPGYVAPSVKASATSVRPVPVIRARPEERASRTPLMVGTFESKMDGKGGLVLPKEVCEQMGKCESVLLTPGPDGCLWLVSQDGAARMLQRIEKAQVGDAEVQAFKRLYFSQTEKASVDTAGGLKVPEKLAEFAGLAGDAVLIGMDDHFELWEAARWQRYSQQKGPIPPRTHEGIE
jgi:MraZ protein